MSIKNKKILKASNLTTKFGQLIEYNTKTFILKSHTQNVVETSPRPFSGNLKLTISLDQ